MQLRNVIIDELMGPNHGWCLHTFVTDALPFGVVTTGNSRSLHTSERLAYYNERDREFFIDSQMKDHKVDIEGRSILPVRFINMISLFPL